MPDPFEHNPDENPNWKPKLAYRIYKCEKCGTETKIQTNHTGSTYGTKCAGKCKTILNAHTAYEEVYPYYGKHLYVREEA